MRQRGVAQADFGRGKLLESQLFIATSDNKYKLLSDHTQASCSTGQRVLTTSLVLSVRISYLTYTLESWTAKLPQRSRSLDQVLFEVADVGKAADQGVVLDVDGFHDTLREHARAAEQDHLVVRVIEERVHLRGWLEQRVHLGEERSKARGFGPEGRKLMRAQRLDAAVKRRRLAVAREELVRPVGAVVAPRPKYLERHLAIGVHDRVAAEPRP